MVTEPSKWFSDIFVVQRSIYNFFFDGSVSWTQQSVVQAGGGCLSDLYDDTDSIALYMLAVPDFLTFINEFESVQNHLNSLDVHHKESL